MRIHKFVFIHIVLSINILFCMENNSIGPIDTIVLTLEVKNKGIHSIKKEIKNHSFKDKTIERKPFTLMHECAQMDNSTLSNQVFLMIDSFKILKKAYKCSNPLNQRPTSIDECSSWQQGLKENTVTIITEFYDRKTLLAALHNLPEYKNKKYQNMGLFL